MSETKNITSLYVVTDTENSYDKIGDIDGGMFDDVWLENYIKNHGTEKIIGKLAHMQMQVLQISDKINRDVYKSDQAKTIR